MKIQTQKIENLDNLSFEAFKEQFLGVKLFKKTLSDQKIDLDKNVLSENGINPDSRGFYAQQQISELYEKLRNSQNSKREYIENDYHIKEFYSWLIKNNFEYSPEIKKFLIATISPRFIEDLVVIRKNLKIPVRGFENKDQCMQWFEKIDKEFKSNKRQLFVAGNDLSFDFKSDLLDKISLLLNDFFNKYNIQKLSWGFKCGYLFYDFNSPIYKTIKRGKHIGESYFASDFWIDFGVQNFETITAYTPKWTLSLCDGKWGGVAMAPHYKNDCFAIHIEFTKGVMRKEHLESFVKNNFKLIKKEFDEYKKRKENTEQDFNKHWFLYYLYKIKGYKPKQIKVWYKNLPQPHKIISDKNFKQIIRRMKKRIQTFEKVDK